LHFYNLVTNYIFAILSPLPHALQGEAQNELMTRRY